jgi:hypothetical protein
MVMGIAGGGLSYLLAGRWDHGAVISGIAIGTGIGAVGLIDGLRTPPDKLTTRP